MFSATLLFLPRYISQRWQEHAFRGALFKVLSCLCFAGIYGCVRYFSLTSNELGAASLPAPELAFFETALGLLFLLPWILLKKREALKIQEPYLYIGRAVVVAFGVILWYMALARMPLIQVIAFKYTAPVFTFLGAKFLLKERCGFGRGISILVAFLGALIVSGNQIISNDNDWLELSFLIMLPLGATACQALSAMFGKKQAPLHSPHTITLYLLLFTLPIFGGASLFQWVQPQAWQWPWLIAMGGLLAGGYIFLSHAYVAADITYLIPASFSRLVAAAFIGILFFDEWPHDWAWFGLFLIVGSTLSLCQFELKRKKNVPCGEYA